MIIDSFICQRCGKYVEEPYGYRKILCKECDDKLNEQVKRIDMMLEAKKNINNHISNSN